MGGTRIAALAVVSHGRHYNQSLHHELRRYDGGPFNFTVFIISATLCVIIIGICAVCWRRVPDADKPAEIRAEVPRAVYTVSADFQHHPREEFPCPPPAYDTVVQIPCDLKDTYLQEVIAEPCACYRPQMDWGLPSYEAAVQLRDTRL